MEKNKKHKRNAGRPEKAGANKAAAGEARTAPDLFSPADPLGSYTGAAEDGGEPVQDQDDL